MPTVDHNQCHRSVASERIAAAPAAASAGSPPLAAAGVLVAGSLAVAGVSGRSSLGPDLKESGHQALVSRCLPAIGLGYNVPRHLPPDQHPTGPGSVHAPPRAAACRPGLVIIR
jgi:hypothetical protein